ncbi:hypothetical protein [Glaciimonas sp. PAMC28666]|uniref:hypothetical protein n=1 Tax=Glaciimonas sp. PAMC28666 TaxID=2807626 RepID=UPI001965D51F|nr:hypothetical protein [Glaciimonas sp. PAMC28666]QRX83990.1 hypothetical protein JQN73_07210 [Glaciimonas sp. PAMC28666]
MAEWVHFTLAFADSSFYRRRPDWICANFSAGCKAKSEGVSNCVKTAEKRDIWLNWKQKITVMADVVAYIEYQDLLKLKESFHEI